MAASPLALLVALLVAGSARAAIEVAHVAARAEPGPAPGGDGAAVSAAATPATLPGQDAIIAGKPCTYTAAVLPRFVNASSAQAAAPLLTCRDLRLNVTQQADCMACLASSSKWRCLSRTSATYYGADRESCTWVGYRDARTKHVDHHASGLELRYRLGVNVPWLHSYKMAATTCAVRLEFEITDRNSVAAYPTAFFDAWMTGLDANGTEIPRALQNEVFCLLKNGVRKCSKTLVRPSYAQMMVLSRNIWTNRLAVVESLAQTNTSCLDSPAGVCSSSSYKFSFALRLVEVPCRRGQAPGAVAASSGLVPYAEPGTIMYPGGRTFSVWRDLWFFTEGTTRVAWTIRARHPIFVAAMNETVLNSACRMASDQTFLACDYPSIVNQTIPGTYCGVGKRLCSGMLTKAKADKLYLVVTYPTKFNIVLPPSTVYDLDEAATPTMAVDIVDYRVLP